MGRIYIADLLPGGSTRPATWFTTPFNPEGDWGNAYQLAHPGASVEVVCDFHAKRVLPLAAGGVRHDYLVTINNAGSVITSVFVDW
jgi:hypothetical protein